MNQRGSVLTEAVIGLSMLLAALLLTLKISFHILEEQRKNHARFFQARAKLAK